MIARRMWQLFEPIHAVTYFAPEPLAAAEALGLKGFWAGYVVFRAAPLGAVGPDPVTAAFFGFAPRRAAKVLPHGWSQVRPEHALQARRTSAASALRRAVGDLDVALAAELAWEAAQAADTPGRVLAAANQGLPRPDEPFEALWQATTTLREHRGDGHVAALIAHGLDPVEALVLKTASGEVPGEQLRLGRAWSEQDWADGQERLRARGLLEGDTLSVDGVEVRQSVEDVTDVCAQRPWEVLGDQTDRLAELLEPLAHAVYAGTVPRLNPIGVSPPQG